jgi:hypothetical protein
VNRTDVKNPFSVAVILTMGLGCSEQAPTAGAPPPPPVAAVASKDAAVDSDASIGLGVPRGPALTAGACCNDDAIDLTTTAPPPSKTITFSSTDAVVLNPERGFYIGIDVLGSSAFDGVRGGGFTLALAQVRLDAYRDTAIPDSLLTQIDDGLARVRTAGFKVIMRFKYNDGGGADASRAQILAHIAQLAPLFQSDADVIDVVQAGFIGEWGEWHDSTNGLDNPSDRAAVLNALLAAVPTSRMVQVRTPNFIDEIFPGTLSATRAFDGSNQARTGHHNDCFLASDDDFGTYPSPIAMWKDYVAQLGRFTPIGGETCNPDPPRSECAIATAEMSRLHYSYLNSEYHQAVLDSWTQGGCKRDVVNQLGYRFRPIELRYNDTVKPGGVLGIELQIANDGFASPYNERPVKIVLTSSTQRYVAVLSGRDPRRWESGTTATIRASLRVPSAAPPGTYTLSLWLPDASASLEARPEYAIALAADGLVIDAAGANQLGTVTLDPAADGPSVSDATMFTEL